MNKEITLNEAEIAFKSYGCTHFHMSRDEPDLYAKYKELNITVDQELKWTKESFYELCELITERKDSNNNLWWIHSSATTLAEYIKDHDVLKKLYDVSLFILDYVPPKDTILCAENILDRRDVTLNCGIIFILIELGDKELAKKFLDLSYKFLERFKNKDKKRSEQVYQRIKTISVFLKK